MDARLYTIEGRSRGVDAQSAQLAHFILSAGEAASPQMIVDDLRWMPYCLDAENRRVIFVDVPTEVDLSDAVFAHLTQFHHARRVLAVPYESLAALSAQVSQPQNLIFIFNLARAGTTLVHRMLNQVEGVWCLSEADIYTDISGLERSEPGDEEILYLIRHCTPLTFRPRHPNQTLALKFRSQALLMADLFYRAFPQSKCIFLYRDALSWGNSFYKFVQRLDATALFDDGEIVKNLWAGFALQADVSRLETFIGRPVERVGIEEFFPGMYAIHIEKYMETFRQGVPYYAIRYNELDRDREAVAAKLLEHCGLPQESLPQVMLAFDSDAQEGTQLARDRPARSFTAEQSARFLEVLRRHPQYNSPDILLPDIYHPDRVV
jgi:hypothetical protein